MKKFTHLQTPADNDQSLYAVKEYAKAHGAELGCLTVTEVPDGPSWKDIMIHKLSQAPELLGSHVLIYDVTHLLESMQQVFGICKSFADKGISLHMVKHHIEVEPHPYNVSLCEYFSVLDHDFRQNQRSKLGRPRGIRNKRYKLDIHENSILKHLDQGLAYAQVAKIHGVHIQTLIDWLHRRNIRYSYRSSKTTT